MTAVTGGELVKRALLKKEWAKYAVDNGLTGDWGRARQYGLTRWELHAMYLRQEGRCYLCGDPLPKNLTKTAIDHDHTCCPGLDAEPRGKYRISCGKCVRGIACGACNHLIGNAQDDPERLRRVADNLEAANLRVGRPDRARRLQVRTYPE